MTDKILARLILEDPQEGLRVALNQYGGICNAILYRMLGPRSQDIEECLSAVLCKLWQSIGQYDPEKGSLKSWICRIARNTAVDTLRRGGVEILPLEEDLPDLCADVAERIERASDVQLVQQMVDNLGEPDRTIFIRRYYYLERVPVIAASLSMTEKAVERRLSRGREKMKKWLLEKGVSLP